MTLVMPLSHQSAHNSLFHCALLQAVRLVLAACCELVGMCAPGAFTVGQGMAAVLVKSAAQSLPKSASNNRNSSSSSSSSSGLKVKLWEQVEQSGLLQQLPPAVSRQAERLKADHFVSSLGLPQHVHTVNLVTLIVQLRELQPTFFTAHAAGKRCVVPAMHLSLNAIQYASMAFTQAGRQDWMELLLRCCWQLAGFATAATASLLDTHEGQEAAAAGRGSSGGSGHGGGGSGSSIGRSDGTSQQDAAIAVLQVEQTLQWSCMSSVVIILAHWLSLQTAAAANAGTCSSSSSSSTAVRCETATATAATASSSRDSSRPASNNSQCNRHDAASSVSGQQWLPTALAPNMPAAYSSMLQQLGCGREVGLLIATLIALPGTQAGHGSGRPSELEMLDWLEGLVAGGMRLYGSLLDAMSENSIYPQLANMHFCMAAAAYQWLSCMPPDRLMALPACEVVCRVAASAYCYGLQAQFSMPQAAGGGWATCMTANQALAQLSAAALAKLLKLARNEPGSRMPSIASSSSSSSRDSYSNSFLTRSCQHILPMMSQAIQTAADLESRRAEICSGATTCATSNQPGAETGWGSILQLPVQHSDCCKLLQDGVRLVMAATAAVASPDTVHELSFLLRCVGTPLGYQSGGPVLAISGPLVAPVAAAGDMSSPEALQLFGLLCSLLKACSSDARIAC